MSDNENPFPSSLTGMLGRSSLNEEELADLRRKAWAEQGLLIIHPWDHRLAPSETLTLRRIGVRLYGEGGKQ